MPDTKAQATHRVLASMARSIKNRVGDDERQALLQLEDDLLTAPPRPDHEPRLSVELAVWCAEQVLPIYEGKHPDDQRPRKAIEAARAWLAEPTEEHRKAAAAYAAAAAAYAAAAGARSSAVATPGPVDLLRGLIGRYQELAAADAMRSEHAAATQGEHR
jgi:hypothetical protein